MSIWPGHVAAYNTTIHSITDLDFEVLHNIETGIQTDHKLQPKSLVWLTRSVSWGTDPGPLDYLLPLCV